MQMMSRSSERLQYEKLTGEQREEKPARGLMLFDREAFEKVLALSLAYAQELFPDVETHVGGLGTMRQEHAHASMRADVHGDHRSSTIIHAILLRMANYLAQGESACIRRAGRHRSRRGEAILPVENAEPIQGQPLATIVPLVIAQVRMLTGCSGFAAAAVPELQPLFPREESSFLDRELWIHRLARTPDSARSRFVSTISQRLTVTPGLSGDRRNATFDAYRQCLRPA